MTNDARPFPHQQLPAGTDPKYLPQDEPMAGTASNVRKAPKEQKVGYQFDVTLDWEAISKVLSPKGFRLNYDGTLDYITTPDYPKGISARSRQLILRDKAYAKLQGRRTLIGAIMGNDALTEHQAKLAKCLIDPNQSKTELKNIGQWVKEWQLPEDELTDRNWRGTTEASMSGWVPRKFLPSVDQFPQKVRDLKFEDIFTIFEGAALEQLKLFLGRVMVGPSGVVDPETKQKVFHTYRNIAIIDGAYAGQGKSRLFEKVMSAIERLGYNVNQSCPSLAGRFNHKAAFTSDLIFTDDTNKEGMAKELSSSAAKILATGGWISTEEKGENAVPVKCTAAMMFLANRVDQRVFWGMDDGMRSRISLISTTPEGQVPPERMPVVWLESLAKQLDVEVDTIIWWALRLATDEFAKYINENAYRLEGRVKELADQANNSNADPLDGAIAGLVLGYMLEKGKDPRKNLDTDMLAIGIKGFLNIKQNPDLAQMLGDAANIPSWSPALGCRWINPRSLVVAYGVLTGGGRMVTPNRMVEEAFKNLSLKDGNYCYANPSVVLPRWTALVSNEFTLDRIRQLYDKMKESYTSHRGQLMTDINFENDYFWNS